MHVALDARLADYRQGGIPQYAIQLARALATLDTTERFTVLRSARPKVAGDEVPGFPIARLLTPPHHRFEQITLPIELLRIRPDVLHSTDFIPPLHRSCKSVITVHDLGFLRYPETLTGSSRRYYGQIREAVRSTDRIIAVSICTRDDLQQLVQADPRKIEVIPEAVDPAFKPIASEQALAVARERLGVDRPYVLFVGSFEPRKNLTTLLDAFAELRRDCDVQLALVGRRGWLDEPVFRGISELRLEPHVRIVEGLPRAELPSIYSAAAVLAFPSLYEGFGLPPLEAMACGCPVVVSNRASLPEVVGDAALLIPPEDAGALRYAIQRVLSETELRAELVRQGLERAGAFSWHKTAVQTLAVYRRVAG